jgi:NADH:ubiquinone oxidoreductase subunit E
MTAPTIDHDVVSVVQAAIEKHGKNRDAMIPVLSEINHVFGYVPREAIREVRKQLHDPARQVHIAESQLYTLTSFYDMLSTKPRDGMSSSFARMHHAMSLAAKPFGMV